MDEKIAELEQRIAKLEAIYQEPIKINMPYDDEFAKNVLKALQNSTRNAGCHSL